MCMHVVQCVYSVYVHSYSFMLDERVSCNRAESTMSSFHTDLLYAGSKWQQLATHLQSLVEPFHHSELAYKERKGKLLRPGWLAWATETPH